MIEILTCLSSGITAYKPPGAGSANVPNVRRTAPLLDAGVFGYLVAPKIYVTSNV